MVLNEEVTYKVTLARSIIYYIRNGGDISFFIKVKITTKIQYFVFKIYINLPGIKFYE